MNIIADFHIHSKYSRATSKDLTLENLEKYARIKGIDLLGTGDFTHPLWFKELKQNLLEDSSGILKSKTDFKFFLQTEISLIYTQDNKGRRIHYLILAPSLDVVRQINEFLAKKGRLDYDGRPIFGFTSIELVEEMNKISQDIEIIPAHAWTPWFSIFGSMSGFDSLEECFKEKTKYIHAIETGMSSDPAMNWRLSKLDNITLVSNSDCHSFWPWRIGREVNVFDFKDLTYKNIINAIRTKKGFVETIEVDPAYGKYHFDGHRNCNVVMPPKEARKLNNICPKCNSLLTIGVAHRIEDLADRPEGFTPKNIIPFKTLIPLSEILSKVLNYAMFTKKVWIEYNKLIEAFKSEFNILLNAKFEDLKKVTSEKIAENIIKNREGKLKVKEGYDGVYGELILNNKDYAKKSQKSLTEF